MKTILKRMKDVQKREVTPYSKRVKSTCTPQYEFNFLKDLVKGQII